jgi:hypothetical protein
VIGRHAKRLAYSPLAYVVGVWLLFIVWRPWFFGFIHDDWVLITPADQISDLTLAAGRSRPLQMLMVLAAKPVVGQSAMLWHMWGATTVLVSAICLQAFLSRVAAATFGVGSHFGIVSAIIAGVWMILPWGYGYAAWPVMFAALTSVPLFCLCGYFSLDLNPSRKTVMYAVTCFMLAGLFYEAFWLAWLPLLGISWLIFKRIPASGLRRFIWLCIAFGIAQIMLTGLNFLLTYWGSGGGKQLAGNPVHMVYRSIVEWPALVKVVFPMSPFMLMASIAFGMIAIALSGERWKASWVISMALIGGVLAAAVFAAAGYKLQARGLFSRTTIALNIWMCVAAVIPVSMAVRNLAESGWLAAIRQQSLRPWVYGAFQQVARGCSKFLYSVHVLGSMAITKAATYRNEIISTAFLTFLMVVGWMLLNIATASWQESRLWKRSWINQRKVIEAFPARSAAEHLRPGTLLVVDLPPRPDRSIEEFEAFWDIQFALDIAYPEFRRAREEGKSHLTVGRFSEFFVQRHGNDFIQRWCREPSYELFSFKAKHLAIWAPGEVTIRYVEMNDQTALTLGCTAKTAGPSSPRGS